MTRSASPKDVTDFLARKREERLKAFNRDEVRIDLSNTSQVRGQLENRYLAPLQLTNPNLLDGPLLLSHGGTSADLSGTGPGVPVQAGVGSPFTVGPLAFGYIDWASTGTHTTGQPLLYDSSGPTADFGPLNLSLGSPILSGLLSPTFGGTGVNNGSRNLTIATNGGTLAFSAASKTLTISETLTLTGSSSGFTLTVPATGTAALLGTAQAFTENNSFAKLLRAHTTSGTTGYGIRFWDGADDFGNFQCLDLGGTSFLFFGTNRQFDGTAWQQLNTRVGGVIQVTGDTMVFNTFPVSSSTPTSRFRVLADGSMGIHGGNSFGSGAGVVSIANRTTAPTVNPTAGGILYAAAGAGTWRGSGGTVTTFAPAGPHCEACGYDAWTVAMRNDAWQAYCYICGMCGARYQAGPASVLGLLGAAERAQIIRRGMRYAEVAALLD